MLTNDRGPVLEFQKRTGYLLVAALLGHLLLISAQVSSQQGASVLETTIFGALSRVQALTAWVTQGVTGAWGNYVALRGTAPAPTPCSCSSIASASNCSTPTRRPAAPSNSSNCCSCSAPNCRRRWRRG